MTSPSRDATGRPAAPLVSVVVTNWNYGRYVAEAVRSALLQDHPRVEVVVVDDGSTDDSRQRLAQFAGRIDLVLQENAGTPAAALAGFQRTRGDIVLFLDADDVLEPQAASNVVAAWREGCVKVQFRLALIDAHGRRLGADPPHRVPMPSGDLWPEVAATGRYPTPVTSGNAYARWFLERLLPVPGDFHNIDGYLNTVAPAYGPVFSLDLELGGYRQHGGNRWAFSGRVDPERLARRVSHDLVRHRHLSAVAAATGRPLAPDLVLRDPEHVLHRLGSLRLGPGSHPLGQDRRLPLVLAGCRAVRLDRYLSAPERLGLLGLLLVVGLAPLPLARSALELLLRSDARPAWLRAAVRVVRRARLGRPAAA